MVRLAAVQKSRGVQPVAWGVFLAILVSLMAPTAGFAQAVSCVRAVPSLTPPDDAPALTFGIYPGGGAGSVADKPAARPEDAGARTAALQQLRGGNRPFRVHLYTAYTGNQEADAATARWMDDEIAGYVAAGTEVELVIRYKPVISDTAAAVRGFADAARATVRRYGGVPGFTSLQVTNEANLTGAPDASDGAFAGAADALMQGVVDAKDETRRTGYTHVRVGFNWASDGRPAASRDFWAALGRGGTAFRDAVDWVGLDAYPGTWYPELPLTGLLPQLTGTALEDAMRTLRFCLMPVAGLGLKVPIHVSENGFPTGPGRSDATQAAALEAMVRSVHRLRGVLNVTHYNWFDLRDSRSTDPNVESQYGLMRDDYTAKPAFWRYRDLVAELTTPGSSEGPRAATACTPSPVKVALPRLAGWRAKVARIRQSGRIVRTVRARALPARVAVRLTPGRARVSVRVTGRRRGRAVTRLTRQTFTVCGTGRGGTVSGRNAG